MSNCTNGRHKIRGSCMEYSFGHQKTGWLFLILSIWILYTDDTAQTRRPVAASLSGTSLYPPIWILQESIRTNTSGFQVCPSHYSTQPPRILCLTSGKILYLLISAYSKHLVLNLPPFDKEPNIYTLQLKYRHCQM